MISRKKRIWLYGIAVIAILIIAAGPLYDIGRRGPENKVQMYHFSGRTLLCCIDLGDDMKNGRGLESGFSYEVLQDFARDHSCIVRIITAEKNSDYIDSLRLGSIDLLVLRPDSAEGIQDIVLSDKVTEHFSIATSCTRKGEIMEINDWLRQYTVCEEFDNQKKLFFRTFNPIKRAERGMMTETVSPYDSLFREHAKELGWDWRMLAAVVYQESKFSISSRSHRGASGLMQVMPQTGAYYNITDLTDPKQNLRAGTCHLKRLQRLYRNCDMTEDQRLRFTLAAYNAGEGRIQDCRNLAKSQNLDENSWSDIVKVIPLMSEDSILTDDNIKLGKFKGSETINYIDNVMNLYDAICRICPR